jgi:hypothetical protein
MMIDQSQRVRNISSFSRHSYRQQIKTPDILGVIEYLELEAPVLLISDGFGAFLFI